MLVPKLIQNSPESGDSGLLSAVSFTLTALPVSQSDSPCCFHPKQPVRPALASCDVDLVTEVSWPNKPCTQLIG